MFFEKHLIETGNEKLIFITRFAFSISNEFVILILRRKNLLLSSIPSYFHN